MSADFWAGYVSGAIGIIVGNPLDLIKTRLQANTPAPHSTTSTTSAAALPLHAQWRAHFENAGTLVRGTTAPILGYGALNALLFVTYNRSLSLLTTHPVFSPQPSPTLEPFPSTTSSTTPNTLQLQPNLTQIWLAGAIGGLASFLVSAPTELIKCRAQVSTSRNTTSWSIAREVWKREGVRGLYYGGGITSIRDAVGYGFYFWSYEWSKRALGSPNDTDGDTAMKVLLCGGLAGIVTWASIFPLDVIKTRVQTQIMAPEGIQTPENQRLLQHGGQSALSGKRLGTWEVARQAYQSEGAVVFFRGLGICSVRAFVVNAVQWAIYEWMMRLLQPV
ncbi:mitochondrial carrier protein-like protein [Sporormia fimetaria CBS 119925]|uniref:Mitochondrial carrier protein-like protein n=1 Tax=Sporormia fimetaria CBS 119925 TaxID=1340428 RepID=A0A6A6V8C4_9PLEO|nr:mitochondrial carrier protein-like protein [Sporormia fimetaria CBS 119925]